MKWLFFIVLILLFFKNLKAQNHDYAWLMCSGFSNSPTSIITFTPSPLLTDTFYRNLGMWRTNTSMSDSSGNLLFYTNGFEIYTKNHQLMQNGNGINSGWFANNWAYQGNNISDGAFSIPHPKQKNKYYLFHVSYDSTGFGENLYSTLINMNANNGFGIVEKKNEILTSDSVCNGQLEAVKHGNGTDWWVLQPIGGSNGFRLFLVTVDTIIKMDEQYLGSNNRIHGYEGFGQASFSSNGELYARYDYENDLDIFEFDRCTGQLSNALHIPISDSSDFYGDSFGGVAFSPNNRYLYVSSRNYLYQFDLADTNIAQSMDTVAIYDSFIDTFSYESTFWGYLQTAPNGKIYGACLYTRYLHVVHQPNLGGTSCNVAQHDFFLHHYNSFLPNFPHYRTSPLSGSACDTITIVELVNSKKQNLKIYPNPAMYEITIEIEDNNLNKDYEMEILNSTGKVLFRRKMRFRTLNLNNENLVTGVYICRIITQNEILNRKFVVQK